MEVLLDFGEPKDNITIFLTVVLEVISAPFRASNSSNSSLGSVTASQEQKIERFKAPYRAPNLSNSSLDSVTSQGKQIGNTIYESLNDKDINRAEY